MGEKVSQFGSIGEGPGQLSSMLNRTVLTNDRIYLFRLYRCIVFDYQGNILFEYKLPPGGRTIYFENDHIYRERPKSARRTYYKQRLSIDGEFQKKFKNPNPESFSSDEEFYEDLRKGAKSRDALFMTNLGRIIVGSGEYFVSLVDSNQVKSKSYKRAVERVKHEKRFRKYTNETYTRDIGKAYAYNHFLIVSISTKNREERLFDVINTKRNKLHCQISLTGKAMKYIFHKNRLIVKKENDDIGIHYEIYNFDIRD